MEYKVQGFIKIPVQMDVHADDGQSAILLAKNSLNGAYNLNVDAFYHKVSDVEVHLKATELPNEEEPVEA